MRRAWRRLLAAGKRLAARLRVLWRNGRNGRAITLELGAIRRDGVEVVARCGRRETRRTIRVKAGVMMAGLEDETP
jgi:hypothetical protein